MHLAFAFLVSTLLPAPAPMLAAEETYEEPVAEIECPRNAEDAAGRAGDTDYVWTTDSHHRRSDGGVLNVHQESDFEGEAWVASATFEWGYGQKRVTWPGTERRDPEELIKDYARE